MRARLAASLVAALCAWLWMSETGPPSALVGLFDPASAPDLGQDGGPRLVLLLPPGTSDAACAALGDELRARFGGRAAVEVEARTVTVAPQAGVRPATVEAMLAAPGQGPARFELAPILEGPPQLGPLRGLLGAHPELGVRDIPSGLVEADDRATLERFLARAAAECAACRPAADQAFLVQAVPARGPDGASSDAPPSWRAELVSRASPVLGRAQVAGAEVRFDERNLPYVLVRFDEEGARRFADLTRAHVGDRVAIAVGGVIVSAPTVMSEIRGGEAQISLGDMRSAAAALAEAQALAAEIQGRVSLPPGTTRAWVEVPPSDPAVVFGVRLGVTLVAALAAFLLALATRRLWGFEPAPLASRVAPSATPATPADGAPPALALRLGVTAAALVVLLLLERVPLPAIEYDALPLEAARAFHLTSLGLLPVLLASLVVALAVAIVPRLRRLRGGGLPARRALGPAWALTAAALAVLQAVGLVAVLRGQDAALPPGSLATGVVALTLVAGTFALWGLAAAVSRWGLGHGLATLTALSGVVGLARADALPSGRLLAALVAVAALALALTERRARDARGVGRRLPLGGLVVLDLGTAVLQLVALVPLATPALAALAQLLAEPVAVVALIALAGVAVAWAYARPMAARAFAPAALASVALLALAALARGPILGATTGFGDVAGLALLPVFLVDVGREALATWRLGPLARVASTSDVDRADLHLAALARAGVPAVLRAARGRALLRFMGPWLPIELLVPASDLERAVAALREDAHAELVGTFAA